MARLRRAKPPYTRGSHNTGLWAPKTKTAHVRRRPRARSLLVDLQEPRQKPFDEGRALAWRCGRSKLAGFAGQCSRKEPRGPPMGWAPPRCCIKVDGEDMGAACRKGGVPRQPKAARRVSPARLPSAPAVGRGRAGLIAARQSTPPESCRNAHLDQCGCVLGHMAALGKESPPRRLGRRSRLSSLARTYCTVLLDQGEGGHLRHGAHRPADLPRSAKCPGRRGQPGQGAAPAPKGRCLRIVAWAWALRTKGRLQHSGPLRCRAV